ncbi:hypothetical protein PAXRUDRAFT_821695 [Paxillus rubicundulus Ve08.2h10]|uniref:Uncharacterized protein n=1 Tax=Paxillus rubicundulus Ve08.2h10 TaxID=930991 RepID=A0A0D0E676_9AGAM|nr:hypothetical protein PAXRUDRAFT_821695 [Paxillus rubicundulus Ve08.2h10]
MLRTNPSVLRRSFRPLLVASFPTGWRRHQSQRSIQKPSTASPGSAVHHSPLFIHDHFAQSADFTISFFKRFAKLSLLGIFTLGITGWSVFEATHMWVENVELITERDDEIRRWEWDRDAEKWSGGELGGTDPALGFKARHALRGAWMAENWGVGSGATFIANTSSGRSQGAGGLNVIEARLVYAQQYLNFAVETAESSAGSGTLRPQTINELLTRQAAILEHMGTSEAFFEARSKYERIWAGLAAKGSNAARIALKLGDLNFRLGDSKDALAWWTRAINLTQGSKLAGDSAEPTVSQSVPSFPSAQRTLASTLVSLSAYYSTSGQLDLARQIQESALILLHNARSPPSISAASPPHVLHSLYLLHRSSLVSIHLAEVLYALGSPRQSSIDYLTRAAESSERVALALSGLPFSSPGAKGSDIAHNPTQEAPIAPVYTRSIVMRKPAKGLLRDARRTAAEAWSLMGVLSEEENNGGMERALECYERALEWAGAASDGASGKGASGEGTLESERKVLWANYVRARDAVRAQEKH